MYRRAIRAFGLFFGGSVCIIGGGFAAIYGLVLLYTATPGTAASGESVTMMTETALSILFSEPMAVVAVVGIAGFVWEVRENGLLEPDDQLRAERMKEMRRELAEKKEEWNPPPEDREGQSIYQDLLEEESNGLLVLRDELASRDPPRVRGVVGNTASTTREELRVRVSFRNSRGETVGSGIATRKELQPGQYWEFEIFQREDADEVASYRIAPPRSAADDAD